MIGGRWRFLLLGCVLLGALLLLLPRADAGTFHWQGAGTGGNTAIDPADPTTGFGQDGNWQEGGTPGESDSASILFTGPGSVHAASGSVQSLHIDGSSPDAAYQVGAGVDATALNLYLGDQGQGHAVQSGGTHAVMGEFHVGHGAGSEGTYTLTEGDLYTGTAFAFDVYLQEGTVLGGGGSGSGIRGDFAYSIPLRRQHPWVAEWRWRDVILYKMGDTERAPSYDDLEVRIHYPVGQLGQVEAVKAAGANSGSVKLSFIFDFTANGEVVVSDWAGRELPDRADHYGEFFDVPVGSAVVGSSGSGQFTQTDGTHYVIGALYLGLNSGSHGTYTISGGAILADGALFVGNAGDGTLEFVDGSVQVGGLAVGTGAGTGTLDLSGPEASLGVKSDCTLGANAHLTAAPGSGIVTEGDLHNESTSEANLADLVNVLLSFYARLPGGARGECRLEVAGRDLGPVAAGWTDNFALGHLKARDKTDLILEDAFDNGNRASAEALYVHDITLYPGATLDLNGLNLYYDGELVNGGTVLGGAPIYVPEPITLALLAAGSAVVLGRRRRTPA